MVLDTPPVGPVIDPVIVANLADKTIFVVQWASTPRELVESPYNSCQLISASPASSSIPSMRSRQEIWRRVLLREKLRKILFGMIARASVSLSFGFDACRRSLDPDIICGF